MEEAPNDPRRRYVKQKGRSREPDKGAKASAVAIA